MHVSKRVIRIRTCLGSVNLKTFRCVTFSSSSTSLKLKYAFSLFYNRRLTLTDKKIASILRRGVRKFVSK